MGDGSAWPGASESAAERLHRRADPDRKAHMLALSEALAGLGCHIVVPDAERDDYVNVLGPPGTGRGRLASMHARTGRVEFQGGSWRAVEESGFVGRAVRLQAGEKAAISPITAADVQTIVTLAGALLAGRGGA